MQLTVIDDEPRVVEATVAGEQILLDPADFAIAVGWEVKPEGLCQGDVCIPYGMIAEVKVGDRIDLLATLEALGRPAVVVPDRQIVAVGQRAENRNLTVDDNVAADFTLPDLHGNPHRFSQHAGKKRILHAFASW